MQTQHFVKLINSQAIVTTSREMQYPQDLMCGYSLANSSFIKCEKCVERGSSGVKRGLMTATSEAVDVHKIGS